MQAEDFGGWPDLDELPLKHMTKEHLFTLASKCSSKSDVHMPVFPTTASPSAADVDIASHTVTPGRNAQIDAATETLASVTPSPGQALKDANVAKAGKLKPPASQKQLEMHRQWQATAESMGGPNARIIVSKPEAKKLIFDVLHDAFAPMNITELHSVRRRRVITKGSTSATALTFPCFLCLAPTGSQGRRSLTRPQAMPQRYGHGQDGR
jgi:hypothetical protein